MEDILKYIKGTTNKLRAIIYQYLWFYENNPDYSAVVLLILKQNRKFLEVAAYEDVRALARFLLDIIKEGIAAGEFRKDINPFLVRSIILGTIEHLVIRRVLLGGPESLVELVDPLIDLIVSGIDARKEEKIWNLHISLEQDKKMEKGKSLSEPEKKRIHPGRQR